MRDEVIIVSGLPRSGTSMMMSMLEAAGVPLLVDGIRTADEDNPKGYYELEQVKRVKEDQRWLDGARGKAVKMIGQLLFDLPAGHTYKILFMRRKIEEILASQREMLIRRGTFDQAVSDAEVRSISIQHLNEVMDWLRQQPHMKVLYVNYNRMLEDPATSIAAIDKFLGGPLDTRAMAQVIDKKLYRQRQ